MANRHLPHDLAQMQSVPLEGKILMTKERIRQWYEYWDGQVYVSFSGGKDSTVLKHIVDSMYNDIPAVFVNTGLEYPEIQRFAKDIKAGKYDCFNPDVEIVRPEMRFDEVVVKYGYPVISKEVANFVRLANPGTTRFEKIKGTLINPKTGELSQYNIPKYEFLTRAPFAISEQCCDVMKKRPTSKYEKQTSRKPMLGLMASESRKRRRAWEKTGCNAFDKKRPQSQPMAFWTEQDILHYIKKYDVPYCSVYGDIVPIEESDQLEGQMTIYEALDEYEETMLQTTGCSRTGCIFCVFGCHLEKFPNRFQRLKETHPRQYEYCIGGVKWSMENGNQTRKGLGLEKYLII